MSLMYGSMALKELDMLTTDDLARAAPVTQILDLGVEVLLV